MIRFSTLLLILFYFLQSFGCSGLSKDPPTIILISIDAFRWDYPEKAETPNLDFLIKSGVRAKSLTPCFPTKTFPNHYTIVTGLYPQNHGIIANNMYDPLRKKPFKLSIPEAIHDPEWWGGEPIWVTAEKKGLKTACYFWPGSETKIKGLLPTYFFNYDGEVPNEDRIKQVLKWLDLPLHQRPSLITTYFSTLDDAGHHYGPDSKEVAEAIHTSDSVIGILLNGLQERKLLQKVNVIIVSDHGMAATRADQIIFLDDYIDLDGVDVVDWNPVAVINSAEGEKEKIYQKLMNAHPKLKVYKKEEVPERFHFGKHPVTPKIVAIADEGWSISSHAYVDRRPGYGDGGNHGFDDQLTSMGATFIASGPAFKAGVTVEPFRNIHIYELMAEILDLKPAPNDGSLDSVRIMLK